jgi:hypothetical protein
MDIDERLEFLMQSTESLHASCQELHATVAEQSRQIGGMAKRNERRHEALFKALEAYLRALNGDGEEEDDGNPA